MSHSSNIRRINRRETHSSRAVASVVTAAILLLAILWLVAGLVLKATGNAALLVSPAELAQRVALLARNTLPAALTGGGIVVAIAGLVLVLLATLGGTKPRHVIDNPRAAVVVDNEVLAAAISRTACQTARLAPEQVSTRVGRKTVDVTVHPSSGLKLDEAALKEAVDAEVLGFALQRAVTLRVAITEKGAVGV
jgi:hypothetical protein